MEPGLSAGRCAAACALLALACLAQREEPETHHAAFKSVPTTVKNFENDTVLLPCYLENAGTDYHVRWFKDKSLIADNSDRELMPPDRVRMFSNHSLQVSRLVASDTGEYICEVVRAKPWSPIHQIHAIEVLSPPAVVPVPEIGILEVTIGQEVDIACSASGVPKPVITWMNKGQEMEILDHRPRLKFKATNRHLAGNYVCVAANGVGEPARAGIQVIIMHPPEVTSDNAWVHTTLGIHSQLECRAIGSPTAKVHWFHGQKPVTRSQRIKTHIQGDRHQLVFTKVLPTDLGVYTCKAENRIGMAEIRLHLSGVANIAVFMSDITKNHPTQTTFTLIWQVDSYSPIIEYSLWFRPYKLRPQEDGVFIDDNDTWKKITIPGDPQDGSLHTISYILRGLRPSTVYEAQVVSRNRFGWSRPSSILHFATDSGVMDDIINSESPNNIPVLEDVHSEFESTKNISTLFATVGSMHTNKKSSTSQDIHNRGTSISFTWNNFWLLIICIYKILLM